MRLLGVVFSLSIAALIGVACSPGGDVNEKLTALTQRVETLEKKVQSGAPAGGGNSALETEAGEALTAINKLVSSGKVDEAKTQLATFFQKYGNTKTSGRARSLQNEMAVVGKATPSNWGIDMWFQGKNEVNLDADKTTLVVFWETWCPHCVREVPKLEEVYDRYKGQGLQVVGLTRMSKGATEESIKAFIAEKKVAYPIAKEDGTVSSHFSVSGIPAAAVVKNHKVVWRGHPASLTDDMLKSWL
jgi:thiol-disulfide isomerase/thioredoxin